MNEITERVVWMLTVTMKALCFVCAFVAPCRNVMFTIHPLMQQCCLSLLFLHASRHLSSPLARSHENKPFGKESESNTPISKPQRSMSLLQTIKHQTPSHLACSDMLWHCRS